jgi:hypothetical protein
LGASTHEGQPATATSLVQGKSLAPTKGKGLGKTADVGKAADKGKGKGKSKFGGKGKVKGQETVEVTLADAMGMFEKKLLLPSGELSSWVCTPTNWWGVEKKDKTDEQLARLHLKKAEIRAKDKGFQSIWDRYEHDPQFRASTDANACKVRSASRAIYVALGFALPAIVEGNSGTCRTGDGFISNSLVTSALYAGTTGNGSFLGDYLIYISAAIFIAGMVFAWLLRYVYGIIREWWLRSANNVAVRRFRRGNPLGNWHFLMQKLFRLRRNQRRWHNLGLLLQSMGWTPEFRRRLAFLMPLQ